MRRTFFANVFCSAIAAFALSSCETSRTVAPYVVVREAQFRTEKTVADRIALPLDRDGRSRVMRYLKAGGNSQLYDIALADPEAERYYGELVNLLSQKLSADDLNKSELKKVLTAGPVHEIIDSREASALSNIHVTAVSDGRYWWIFYYRDPKRLDHLLITLVPGLRPER